MNLNNPYLSDVYPLSKIIIYDGEAGEIIVHVDRITISLSLEEFALLVKEFEEASSAMNLIMLSKVQKADKDQEIN